MCKSRLGWVCSTRTDSSVPLAHADMVPPFLAYYGALTNNVTLMQEAYTQCKLYRNYLRDPSGLWRHIVMGPSGQDPGYWATGNAWAAAGMLRVMSTLMISQQSARFLNETIELASWTTEIVEASFTYQKVCLALIQRLEFHKGQIADPFPGRATPFFPTTSIGPLFRMLLPLRSCRHHPIVSLNSRLVTAPFPTQKPHAWPFTVVSTPQRGSLPPSLIHSIIHSKG